MRQTSIEFAIFPITASNRGEVVWTADGFRTADFLTEIATPPLPLLRATWLSIGSWALLKVVNPVLMLVSRSSSEAWSQCSWMSKISASKVSSLR